MKQANIEFIKELALLLKKHNAAIMVVTDTMGNGKTSYQLAYDVADYLGTSRVHEGRIHTTGGELDILVRRMEMLRDKNG